MTEDTPERAPPESVWNKALPTLHPIPSAPLLWEGARRSKVLRKTELAGKQLGMGPPAGSKLSDDTPPHFPLSFLQ